MDTMPTKSVRWAFNFSKWSPSMSDMLLASSCIPKEEKDRLARFVFKKDVKSSLIGLLMSRKYVSLVTSKKYNEIKFIRSERGRPLVEDDAMIQFNVSHHGNFTVLAGERGDFKLGVDVMKLEYTGGKDLHEFFRIMNRQFDPLEWETIKGAGNEKEQTSMFCRHWCLKESYTKAIGVGVTVYNLGEVVFKMKSKNLKQNEVVDDTELYVKGEKMDEWVFHETLIDSEHCVSVALNTKKVDKIIFQEITFEELIEGCCPLLPQDEQFSKDYFLKMDK